ncbi:RNA polymerase sigma factor [Streptomyces stackebrandtii]|uniref:RNA polymerase sigma factor n=1 Tax=Streptomyces stackebrandtii TaxID=3051177 RepID=UPI0028DD36F9|nr:sigma-70 family RNA polymerase sigma factor [Streptomyces sp. DSM 40976]
MNNDPFGHWPDLIEPDPERPELDAAFETFLRQNQTKFFTIALNRLVDPRDADEALSDAALVMYQKWERIQAHPKPIAMATQILNHKIIDYYRVQARHAGREQFLAEQPDITYLDEMGDQDRLDRALEALRKISPQQAECWEMHKLIGESYNEIAERLGISYTAAKTAASRGQKKLKALLAELSESEKGDS